MAATRKSIPNTAHWKASTASNQLSWSLSAPWTSLSARQFLSDLGRRIFRSSGDDRETSFMFQRSCSSLYRLPRFINCPTYITLHFSFTVSV